MANFFQDILNQAQAAAGGIITNSLTQAQAAAQNVVNSQIDRATNLLPQNIRTAAAATAPGSSIDNTLTNNAQANIPSTGEQGVFSVGAAQPQNLGTSSRTSPISSSPTGVTQQRVAYTGTDIMRYVPWIVGGLGGVAVLVMLLKR